jgi:hypothetical protein
MFFLDGFGIQLFKKDKKGKAWKIFAQIPMFAFPSRQNSQG